MLITDNSVYLGDAYDLIKSIKDSSVDLIITDPPYKFNKGGKSVKFGRLYVDELDDLSLRDGFDYSILDEFVRVMKDINIYIWCSKEQIFDIYNYFVNKYDCYFEIIVWSKLNPLPYTYGHYLSDKELCLYFRSKSLSLKGDYSTLRTVYFTKINKDDKKDYLHPCIKPLEILRNFILNSSNEGDLVLDVFAGSGSTLVASKELNRRFIGFEIDERYYNIIKDRLNGINIRGEMNLFETDFDEVQKDYEIRSGLKNA